MISWSELVKAGLARQRLASRQAGASDERPAPDDLHVPHASHRDIRGMVFHAGEYSASSPSDCRQVVTAIIVIVEKTRTTDQKV